MKLLLTKKFMIVTVMLGLITLLGLLLMRPAPPSVPARYVAEPDENEADESQALLAIGDYWAARVTYPTGQFSQQWVLEAAEQDKAVPRGVPAGTVTYRRGESPLALDPNQFTALGPQPLQSDGCLNCFNYGHVAGRVNVIAIDPVSPTVAYLGSDGGGVWKTTNCCSAATTWTPVTDDPLLSTIAIGDITIDPNNHNVVYAGTGDLRFGSFSFGAAGVLKSTDKGATWTVIGADVFTPIYPEPIGQYPQYQAIGKVKVDPNNSNNLIVGAKTGVYFSYDAGATWTGACTTNNFSTQRQDTTGLLVSDVGTQTIVYAAIGTRAFSTTVQYDLAFNGANGIYSATVPASGCPSGWSLLTREDNGWPTNTGEGTPYPTNALGRIDLAMSPSNPLVIYAQVAAVPARDLLGVWRTTDGGVTWTQRATQSDMGGCDSGGGQSWYDQGLAVDPNNQDVVFLDNIDIFKSVDGADTFTNVTCGYAGEDTVHVDHHALAYLPGSSSVLLAGSDGGAYVSLNASAPANSVTFSQLNDSLNTIEFYSGDITANFAITTSPGINAGAQDNGSSVYVWSGNPGPALWQLRKGGDGMFARIEPKQGLRWYQEAQNGALAVSQTGPFGSQQNAAPGGGAWGGDRKSFILPYELQKYYCPGVICNHMIAGTYRVWETIQGAVPSTSWYANSPDLTKNTLADRSFINQLAYAVTTDTIAIAGTNDGNVQYGFNLGQGVANSATWVNVTGGNSLLPNRPILDVTIDPVDPLIGYAAVGGFDQNTPTTPGHVFQVTCTASCASFTWLDKSGNLPNIPADTILANPNFPQQVFVGTDWGLYFTNNINAASPTWVKFTAGLPNVMIWDMAIDRGFTTLALFTRSRGAYAWPLPSGPVGTFYEVAWGGNSTLSALPGVSVTHTLALHNIGSSDAYTLTVSGHTFPTTLLTSSPLSLSAGLSATVLVQVDLPLTLGLTDTFTITAVSVTSPTVTAAATGASATAATPGVSVSGDQGQSGLMGSVLTYTLAVTNTGNYTDTFIISLGSHVWTTTSQNPQITLGPGQSGTNEVYVTVGAEPSDSVVVTFTSSFSGAVSASTTLTSTRINYQLHLPVIRR